MGTRISPIESRSIRVSLTVLVIKANLLFEHGFAFAIISPSIIEVSQGYFMLGTSEGAGGVASLPECGVPPKNSFPFFCPPPSGPARVQGAQRPCRGAGCPRKVPFPSFARRRRQRIGGLKSPGSI